MDERKQKDKLIEHKYSIDRHGEDLPENPKLEVEDIE